VTISPTSSTSFRDAKRLGLPDIAFVGKAGAGKSTAANLLQQTGGVNPATPYFRAGFAGPLKAIAERLWGPDVRTDRDKLQKLGAALREIDLDVFVSVLMPTITGMINPVVIDDCRFENEWWALKGAGFVMVRVTAPQSLRIDRLRAIGKLQDEAQLDHLSETAIDHLEADYTIENDQGEWELMDAIYMILMTEWRR
jgi:hypothetical protein